MIFDAAGLLGYRDKKVALLLIEAEPLLFCHFMHDIWDLVEAEKPLEDGGFYITDADREWYEDYKFDFEWKKEECGHKYCFPRYTLDY